MLQSLKAIKNRIRSIENTRKVTSAMQMISATKLSRLDSRLVHNRPFARGIESILSNLLLGRQVSLNPFLEPRPSGERIVLCLITADNGLCGVYNNNVIRQAEDFISRYGWDKVKLVIVGKKGWSYFKNYRESILHSYLGLSGRYSDKVCEELLNNLTSLFLSKQADEVYLVYTRFKNALTNQVVVEKFLNIDIKPGEAKNEYIVEPNISRVMQELIPEYLAARVRLALLEAFTSEHASRLVAMRTATENAKDLLNSLVLLRNKVRQASITREIIEIVSAAEALKG
ncbi:MAG: ATP synthase F1 subunit gamma [Candidatus Omnitrophota bacterium]